MGWKEKRLKHRASLSLSQLLIFTSHVCSGQTIASGGKDFSPALTNIIGQQYPRVNSQHQVRFRITSARTQGVPGFNTNLVKVDDGYFTGPTASLDPGFHHYLLKVGRVDVAAP